ncbi:TIM44-like domain-containing protein [Lactococcus lactis]|uniref:TIM44-like domain-containing protein n=1 Tax=Lactococcus lactis TaxID=1358 RepID=UPI00223A6B6C|nr:TIM44-like domain-containing protein [Lactococcus lactis]
MMKKMVILLLISGLVLVTPHAFATAGGFRGGGNRSTRTGGNFGGGNTNSHYNNTVSNSYISNSRTSRMGSRYNRNRIFSGLVALIALAFYFLKKNLKLPFRKREYYQEKTLNDSALSAEIEAIFLKVQDAWDKQDLRTLSESYGDNLYEKHEKILQKMSDKGQINHTRSVVLDGITRYKEVKDNQFEVDLYFVAIDYLVSVNSGQIIAGNTQERRAFKQRWTFSGQKGALRVEKMKEFKI